MKKKNKLLTFEKLGNLKIESSQNKFAKFFTIRPLIMLMLVWVNKNELETCQPFLKKRKTPIENKIQMETKNTLKGIIPDESFLNFFTDIMSDEVYLNKQDMLFLNKKIDNKKTFSKLMEKFENPIKNSIKELFFFASISNKEEILKEKKKNLDVSKNFLIKGGSIVNQLILKPIEYKFFLFNNPLINLITKNFLQLIIFGISSWQISGKNVPIPNVTIKKGANDTIIVRDPDTLVEHIFETLDDALKFIKKHKWYIILLYLLFLFRKPILNFLNLKKEKILEQPDVVKVLTNLKEKNDNIKHWIIEWYRNIRGYSADERNLILEQIAKLRRKFEALKKLIRHFQEKIDLDAEKILQYKKYIELVKKELMTKELEIKQWDKILKYIETEFPDYFIVINDLKKNGVPDNTVEDINLD
jgi:hypothetical protein